MTRRVPAVVFAVAVLAAGVPLAARQGAPTAAPVPSSPPSRPVPALPASPADPILVPLEVTVTISRFKGEEEISRRAYALGVTANGQQGSSLRMGLQVPLVTSSSEAAIPTVNYQPVGVSIDCRVTTAGTAYELVLTVSDDSIHTGPMAGNPSAVDRPVIRSFSTRNNLLLSDGQTREFTAATDPVTGEVVRIGISLRVVK